MIKRKMQLKLMLNEKRNKEITLMILLVITLLSTAIIVEASGGSNGERVDIGKHKRVKRFISMRPGQRFLFRVNGREDALYDIPSWAHGYGFRANYDIIQPLHTFPFHFINRRSVHDEVENMIDLHHGLDGKACLLKTFCDATNWRNSVSNQKMGMLFKVFQVIFEKQTKYLDEDLDCKSLEEKCPFSLLELLPYSDI